MELSQLLGDLELLGVKLELEGRTPVVIPPAGMPEALKRQLALMHDDLVRLRDEIIDYLLPRCPVCERVIADDEDRARAADFVYCQQFANPRCPYKLGPYAKW